MPAASRQLVYWPRGKEYSVAWLLSIVVYFVIAGWRGPDQPLLVTGSLPATTGGRCVFALLLIALSAVLFWGHVRLQFLTWKTARLPIAITFAALVIVYLLLWSAMALIRGRVVPAFPADGLVTAEETANALAGFVAALVFTVVWKTEDPGVTHVRLERQTVLDHLPHLSRTTTDVDFKSLAAAVKALPGSLVALRPRLQFQRDVNLAATWQDAADALAELMANRSLSQILEIPDATRKSALEKLSKEQV